MCGKLKIHKRGRCNSLLQVIVPTFTVENVQTKEKTRALESTSPPPLWLHWKGLDPWCTVTRLWAGRTNHRGSTHGTPKKNFLSMNSTHWVWDPTSPLSQTSTGQGVNMTSHPDPAPTLSVQTHSKSKQQTYSKTCLKWTPPIYGKPGQTEKTFRNVVISHVK